MTTPTALAEAEKLERLYGLLAPLHIGAGWAKATPSCAPSRAPNSRRRSGAMPTRRPHSMPLGD